MPDHRRVWSFFVDGQTPGHAMKAKRQVLANLSTALSALSDRMRSQADAASQVTILAVRAEKIAQRSWDLNSSSNRNYQRDSQVLIGEVKALAKEAADSAVRAGTEALLGREVANAIAAHSADIAKLALDIDTLPDPSAVRARLRPLSMTLRSLPERLKANASTIKDVNTIAALASGLAERGDKFTAGVVTNQEAVALCRDLRRFAQEATAVSLEMTRGSSLAVQAIDDMAKKTISLSRGGSVSDTPLTAQDRLIALARNPPPEGIVWVNATSKRDTARLPPASTVWGAMPVGKNQG
jgi:hypothetical protein